MGQRLERRVILNQREVTFVYLNTRQNKSYLASSSMAMVPMADVNTAIIAHQVASIIEARRMKKGSQVTRQDGAQRSADRGDEKVRVVGG